MSETYQPPHIMAPLQRFHFVPVGDAVTVQALPLDSPLSPHEQDLGRALWLGNTSAARNHRTKWGTLAHPYLRYARSGQNRSGQNRTAPVGVPFTHLLAAD